MPKFSVKKPFTVLVGVILALVMGVVCVVQMSTDLLPTISLPYLMVLTTYPGASPEKVESDITAPLEGALGTINGVENVTSTSSENFSIVMLEFSENTDMDSAMVKATTKLNQLADALPERAGTPSIIEISDDMMATEYLAVDYEGMDIYDLSEYVSTQVIPALERIDGVARVVSVGLVEQTVEITLNQDKIDVINDKLLAKVSQRLTDAMVELDKAQIELDKGKQKLYSGKKQMQEGQKELDEQQDAIGDQISGMLDSVQEKIPELEKQIGSLEDKLDQASDFLGNLGGRLGELADRLNTGENDTFAAFHHVIAEYAPDWYAANSHRLPWSVGEIVHDESKLNALIDGLEAALDGIRGAAWEFDAWHEQVRSAEAAVSEAEAQIAELEAQLEAVLNPASEAAVDEEAASALEEQIAQARAIRDELRAELEALRSEDVPMADVDPDVIAQIIDVLRKAHEFSELVNSADDSLYKLSSELGDLNDYREELEGALRDIQRNPLDADLGDTAAQLLLSGIQAQLAVGKMQISSGEAQIQAGQAQLDAAKAEYEAAKDEALRTANLDDLLNMQALAQIIGAQNFSMPAGYIQDKDDNKFLMKVGESYESVDELSGALLCTIDGIGDVRLSDVADIAVTDNSADTYARVNGNQAVLLSVYKGSTASTSDVSDACNAKAKKMMEEDPNLRLTPIMDQGEYIRLIIKTVTSNLIQGALLAVIVLIFFLKDVRPTLVVAISIPLSVLLALVAMYFSGITLNIISLSGLALGIGMLVDNSIVVIENIYRLRSRDIPAARAAVQGTRQVAGSIISSTVTTICVFLPMLFTTGLVRQLMMDLAMTITFALLASLVIAMTVVPCAGSTVLKKANEKKHPWFDKFLVGYDKLLRFCLRRKIVPVLLSVALLLGCVWQVGRTGLVLIPNISSNQMSMAITMDEGTPQEEAYATADAAMEAALATPGIESIGVMSAAEATELMSGGMGLGGNSVATAPGFSFFIVLDEEGGRNQQAVQQALLENTKDLPCNVVVSGSFMADTSALLGSGVEVDIYGENIDTLLSLSNQVEALMADIPGITDISNGQEAGDKVIMVVVDKDKAMRLGLTVAQVYMDLAQSLTTDTTSTTLTTSEDSYVVNIIDTTKTPRVEDILDHTFETQTMDENGKMVKETHTLGEFAIQTEAEGVASITRENLSRLMKVTSSTAEGYNTALIARDVQEKLDALDVPDGYTVRIAGETTQVNDMVMQMSGMMALALLLIYLVMVAQFQSLLSPFIVLFTIPLAFTGGFLALIITGEEISLVSLMGFLILMGVVVNNGIVFVDYTNQLRLGGMSRLEALVATGKTRMRPILMTTMTTVLSMVTMLFSNDPGSEMGRGMAVVIVGGLLYATLMTLVIVPVMYDILFKKQPVDIDVGDEGMDDLPDDAAEFLAQMEQAESPAK